MLRIGVTDVPAELKLVLQGQLVDPWVFELKKIWDAECSSEHERRCVVDLKDVTRVDESGKSLLAEMKCGGAELFASGVLMKHLVRCLRRSDVQ